MMNNIKIIALFILSVLVLYSFSLANESKFEKELFRVTSSDSKVTAIWIGADETIDPDLKGMPLTFGVHKLLFEFSSTNERIVFNPTGELYFSDWVFKIFSPNQRYVALLQDHFGPYHIIPINNLKDYLSGGKTKFEIVDGRGPDGTGVIHGPVFWLSDNEIRFGAACCGGGYVVTHKIGGETQRGKWKSYRKNDR